MSGILAANALMDEGLTVALLEEIASSLQEKADFIRRPSICFTS